MVDKNFGMYFGGEIHRRLQGRRMDGRLVGRGQIEAVGRMNGVVERKSGQNGPDFRQASRVERTVHYAIETVDGNLHMGESRFDEGLERLLQNPQIAVDREGVSIYADFFAHPLIVVVKTFPVKYFFILMRKRRSIPEVSAVQ